MVSIVLYLSETYSNCSKIGNSIKTALDIIRHKLPDFYTSHLQDDDFKITKEEFIDRHIDELIMLESTGRRSRRDNYVFDFREMNSYIDYEAAPVARLRTLVFPFTPFRLFYTITKRHFSLDLITLCCMPPINVLILILQYSSYPLYYLKLPNKKLNFQ